MTSETIGQYVPLLNGTAFMGMAHVGVRGTFDATNGPYVRAADYDRLRADRDSWKARISHLTEVEQNNERLRAALTVERETAREKVRALDKILDTLPGEASAVETELKHLRAGHVCGLQGFGALGDVCPACSPLEPSPEPCKHGHTNQGCRECFPLKATAPLKCKCGRDLVPYAGCPVCDVPAQNGKR